MEPVLDAIPETMSVHITCVRRHGSVWEMLDLVALLEATERVRKRGITSGTIFPGGHRVANDTSNGSFCCLPGSRLFDEPPMKPNTVVYHDKLRLLSVRMENPSYWQSTREYAVAHQQRCAIGSLRL